VAHGVIMQEDRVFIDHSGQMYRIKSPQPLEEPPKNLRIARRSQPWSIYSRMLGTVLPAFFLMYTLLFIILGLVSLEPVIVLASSICSAPLVFLILRLHRPRLVHVRLAVPDSSGSEAHALPEGGSLRTPMKTSLSRFLVNDDSILDVPPSRQLWSLFAAMISIGVATSYMLLAVSETIGIIIFLFLAIPLWLIGFSLPVLAWWGTSNKLLGLPTRRRDAEAWLMAGMASAFPAFIFNSLVAPEIVPFEQQSQGFEFILLAFWAPIFEEIFKAMAVAIFFPFILGPKHGFQVGFTVGLGFALIENFQYIGLSVFGGPASASFTILVRGIGSIPGHAIWTAISGTAIGWLASDKQLRQRVSSKARSIAISAIDLAEGAGIDVDGDGDLSGFDGDRVNPEEAPQPIQISSHEGGSNSWMIIGSEEDDMVDNDLKSKFSTSDFILSYGDEFSEKKPVGFLPPRGLLPALLASILGHSFWNGSSYISFIAPTEWLGLSPEEGLGVMLLWTLFLISSVLLIARGLIRGVNSLE